jgi:tyrosyl-tRNA synthetase
MPSKAAIDWITRRGVNEIISKQDFILMLQSGKSLRLKMGFDPSRTDIHLGHVVGLRKLRQLQEMGHQVILIVGDWTAQIGDPTGQSVTRSMLTQEEVAANAKSYLSQFFKVVDRDRTEVVWQSEWFGDFTMADIIRLTSKFTVAQFLERDDFARRFKGHRPIALTELLYPLLQAYDSVAVQSDVEFGGTDQKFNLLVGRELQVMMGQPPQQCVLMPILVGTEGVHKMSKSLGNYVGVEDPPKDMYGKLMSLPDHLIVSYFDYLTDTADKELGAMTRDLARGEVNPMSLKKRLAWELCACFHDRHAADAAQEYFEMVIQRKDIPQNIPEFTLPGPINIGDADLDDYRLSRIMVTANLSGSSSEAKRLISQGAVELVRISGESQILLKDHIPVDIRPGDVIKVGKRRFARMAGR